MDATAHGPSTGSTARRAAGLIGWLALCYGVAAFGAQFSARGFYQSLNQPAWAPPGWVFGPVWTALYTMMAIAAWLVWREGGFRGAPLALGLFLVQLAFNGAWSWIFFGMGELAWGFADIVALWVSLLATTVVFWRRDRLAGALMIPYLAWVTFAAALNFAIWRMNA